METSSHSSACIALLATFSNPPPFIPQKVLENRVLFCTKTEEVENRIHGNSASGILVLVLVPVNNDDVGLAV